MKRPISADLIAEDNQLDLRVATLWINRLIGDAPPGAKKVSWKSCRPTAPMRHCGLPA